MTGSTVQFPRPTAFIWLYLIGIGIAAVAVWAILAGSTTNSIIAIIVTVLVWVVIVLARFRPRPELQGGTLIYRTLLRTRRIEMDSAREIRLRPNNFGAALLQITPRHGVKAYLPILVMTAYTKQGLPPDDLDRLGAALGPACRDGVRTALAMQAEHLRKGGSLQDSPLRPLTKDALLKTAQGAGLLSLLDR